GFTRALFRVEEQELGQGGTCNMTLLVENASLYAWDKDDAAPVQAAAPIVYDNRNNPLILALDDLDNQLRLILSDDVITHGREKREIIRQWQALEAEFNALDARFTTLGSPADTQEARNAANASYQSLATYLASLSPPWQDVESDTSIDGAELNQRWASARQALEEFAAAITGRPGRDGSNGKDGAPGEDGADGRTSYIHYAYANSPDGRVDFELSQPNGRAYEGSYTDFTAADSNDPAAYVWREYKGPPFGLATRGAAVVAGNTIIKNGGSPAWDSDGYSTSGYKNGCAISFKADPSAAAAIMCGLNTDPTADASYGSLDYAWYPREDGNAEIFESGGGYGVSVPGYGEGLFGMDYDGRYIRYLYNQEVRRTVDIGPGFTFYLDSSIYTPSARIRDIQFGSYPTRASNGVTLIGDTSTTQIAGNSVRGTGSAGWGSEHAHSLEAYSGGASASWTIAPGAGSNSMAGLGQGTGTDRGNGYDSITFAIFRQDNGATSSRINGNGHEGGPTVDMNKPMACRVHYDGLRYVNFFINGTLFSRFEWGKQTDALRFIAALASVNPRLDDIVLTPSGANGTDGRNGLDGTNGTDGKDGTNGASSFVHLAYADSADGSVNFTTGAVGGRAYVGIYRDQVEADSGDYRAYAWSRLRGIDGTNGKDGTPGRPGADGLTPYTHFAYANSPDGSSHFSTDDPAGRTYLGVYTDYTVADSTDYRAYSWSLIKGADGAQGPAGISVPQPLALTDLDGTLPAVLVKPGQTITGQVRESFQNNSQSGTVTIQLQYRVGSGGWNYMDQRQANVGPGEPGGVFFSAGYTSQAADDVLVQIRVVSDAPGGTSLRTSSPNYLRAY
ncbi:hypothetical protein GGQ96_004060, partial [Sphingomonas abaci]